MTVFCTFPSAPPSASCLHHRWRSPGLGESQPLLLQPEFHTWRLERDTNTENWSKAAVSEPTGGWKVPLRLHPQPASRTELLHPPESIQMKQLPLHNLIYSQRNIQFLKVSEFVKAKRERLISCFLSSRLVYEQVFYFNTYESHKPPE